MGANLLVNLLGTDKENSLLDEKFCVQAPMKMWISGEKLKTFANYLYDRGLWKCIKIIINEHK